MSVSLRDLMRREKAKRREEAIVEEKEKLKRRVVHFQDETDTSVSESSAPFAESHPTSESPRILEETYELVTDSDSDSCREGTNEHRNHSETESKGKEGFPEFYGVAMTRGIIQTEDSQVKDTDKGTIETIKLGSRVNNLDSGSSVIDRDDIHNTNLKYLSSSEADLSTEDKEGVSLNTKDVPSVSSEPNLYYRYPNEDINSAVYGDTEGSLMYAASSVDDDVRIYDQLNTAFCSRIDYEREQIMANVEGSDIKEELFQPATKATIVSDNFGKSSIRLSKDENLPEGFFDNKKADAKARGKLTSKEASEKIKTLEKSKAELMREAKYLQDKTVESYIERRRLQNDVQEHEEAVKQLITKVESIKNDLHMDNETREVEMDNKQEISDTIQNKLDALYAYEGYDDMTWRMKSLI